MYDRLSIMRHRGGVVSSRLLKHDLHDYNNNNDKRTQYTRIIQSAPHFFSLSCVDLITTLYVLITGALLGFY